MVISIRCSGQTDSVICLYNNQVDFLILEQRSAVLLREDTASKAVDIKTYKALLDIKDHQYLQQLERVDNKNNEVDAFKKANADLTIKYNKSQKWLKVFKNTTLIFISTTLVLVATLFLLH